MTPSITVFKTVKGVTPIKVGRRIFVSGLYWQVLPNGQNYMQEARKIARQERERTEQALEVVLLRKHVDVVQAGFVVRGGRARKGTVSLAAVAADQLGPTFIAAFALPDGRYALASAIHDAIVPDSDGVYEPAQARERLSELWNALSGSVEAGELQVYAPADLWPAARPIELASLLAGVRRTHRLRQRPTLTKRSALIWSAWVVSTVAAFTAWTLWQAHQERIAHEQAMQLAREQARAQGSANEKALPRENAYPWTNQPDVHQFAHACTDAIGQLPLTLDGWVLLNAQCNVRSTSATYARTDGRTVRGFDNAATQWRPQSQVHFSSDGDLGTLQWPMQMRAAGNEGLEPLDQRLRSFMTWWQKRLIAFETTPTTSKFAPGYSPISDPEGNQEKPDWKTLRWEIKATPRTPVKVLENFKQGGVRLQQIELTFGTNGQLNWSFNGELYAQ